MEISIAVDNIKCGGCANSIRKKLQERCSLADLAVDVEQGMVQVSADNDIRAELVAALRELGHPERGSVTGVDSLKAKAKSFVSCAVGRMDR